MITDEGINDLMDECINALCDDNPQHGAESLVELAHIFARAGMTQEIFQNIRAHIIKTAIQKTGDSGFIWMKLEESEKSLHRERRLTKGNSNIIIH